MSVDFVAINKAEFFRLLKLHKFGTGTIASAVYVKNDEIQRLIALEGGPEELVSKLADILGPSLLEDDDSEDEVEDIMEQYEEEEEIESGQDAFVLEGATIDSILNAIEDGRITKEEAYEFEIAKDKPRSTLIESLA